MTTPVGGFPSSISSSSSSTSTYFISGHEVTPEIVDKYNLKTDKEIDELTPEQTKEILKGRQIDVLNLHKKNEENQKDKESLVARANAAVAHSTNTMAVDSIRQVQQNRADAQVIKKGTFGLIFTRAVSILIGVGALAFTIVCFLL
jgi:hypothetical protein